MTIEYISLGVGIATFLLGWYLGKRDKNEQLNQIVKAFNIDRILDGRDKDNAKLVFEEGKVHGEKTIKESVTFNLRLIDWKKKKILDEGGYRDLTPKEIEELSKKSPYRKTPL